MIDILTGITIGLHIASAHIPADDRLHNVNPGIYARHEATGITAGVYRNSFARTSVYLGYTASDILGSPLSLTVGAISGYQTHRTDRPCDDSDKSKGWTHCWDDNGHTRGAVGLLVAPSVRLPAIMGIAPRLTVLPKFSAKGKTVLHLSVEHAF